MTRPFFWFVIGLIFSTLSGCASMLGQPNSCITQGQQEQSLGLASIFNRERYTGDDLLVYAKRFSDLSAENQKREYALVTQSLTRNKNDSLNRLKAALIFSVPSSRYRDTSRAQALFTELQREKQADDVAMLITIFKDYVDDWQKLEDNNVKLIQKNKYEQHRADELQQKLDELKNIEKTLIERDSQK